MVNFGVEKKVPHYFLDWNANVSKTFMQKSGFFTFFGTSSMMSNTTNDIVFDKRRRITSDSTTFHESTQKSHLAFFIASNGNSKKVLMLHALPKQLMRSNL